MCDDDNSGQLDLAQFEAFFKVILRDAATLTLTLTLAP